MYAADGTTPAAVDATAELAQYVTEAAPGNITSVGTLTSLSVTGNVDAGNISGTLTTAAQTNITSVGVLNSLVVMGNVAAGNVSGTSIVVTLATASQPNITTIGQLASLGVTGNITAGNVSGTNITGTLTTAAQPNITSIGTVTSLGISGNVNLGGNINNTGSNGTGNIGSSTTFFNTVFAKATSAQYADLAEVYVSDVDYPAGTVVVFGGQKEITQSTAYAQMSIVGVISTHPAHVMNAGAAGLPVALQGRVPCRVMGVIRKGDLVTSSEIAGVATRLDPADWIPGSVIGKALEDHNDGEGIIEVVVGRV